MSHLLITLGHFILSPSPFYYLLLHHFFTQNSKLTSFINLFHLCLFLYPPDWFHGFCILQFLFGNFLFWPCCWFLIRPPLLASDIGKILGQYGKQYWINIVWNIAPMLGQFTFARYCANIGNKYSVNIGSKYCAYIMASILARYCSIYCANIGSVHVVRYSANIGSACWAYNGDNIGPTLQCAVCYSFAVIYSDQKLANYTGSKRLRCFKLLIRVYNTSINKLKQWSRSEPVYN